MELSTRVVQVRSTLKPEEEFPSFHPDDIIPLFGDIAKPMGVVLNHNNLSECFVIFPYSETVPDILKLADTPKWVGTHMNLTADRPRVEITPIIVKLLENNAWKKGKNMNSYQLKYWNQGSQHNFYPKEGGAYCYPVGR